MRRRFLSFANVLPLVLALAVLAPLSGCGGGGAPAPSPSPSATPTPTGTRGQYLVTDVTPNTVVSSQNEIEVEQVSASGKIVCGVTPDKAQNSPGLYSYDINSRTFDKVFYSDPSTNTTLTYGRFMAVSSGGLSIGTIYASGTVDTATAPFFVYDTTTKTVRLLPADLGLFAPTGINDNGDIINNDTKGGINLVEASVFKKAGDGTYTKTLIDYPNGTDTVFAKFINNAGVVFAIGGSRDNNDVSLPFLWHNGVSTPLTLPTATDVLQLTDSGLLVGTRIIEPDGKYRSLPFLWKNGVSIDFTLPEDSVCNYTIANNQGDVLGLVGETLYLWKHDAYDAPLKLESLLASSVSLKNAQPLYFFDDGRILLRVSALGYDHSWLQLLTPR